MVKQEFRPQQTLHPELLPADSGSWCFRLADGRYGCSRRDPEREARLRCASVRDTDRPLLLGLNLGFVLDILHRRCRDRVSIVEPDKNMLELYLKRTGQVELPGDVEWVTGSEAEILRRLTALMDGEHGERPLLLDPTAATRWMSCAPGLGLWLESLLKRRAVARMTEKRLSENEAANRRILSKAMTLDSLVHSWGEDDVLVCGAGPGLINALNSLEHMARRVVAVSTALPVLHVLGLKVDLAVATDPSPLLAKDAGPWLRDTRLLCFPGTSRELVAAWPGRHIVALPAGNGLRETSWHGLKPGTLEAGFGTVAGPALLAAAKLSRGRITLAGVDLNAGEHVYAPGVRRPDDLPLPDFSFARERMREVWIKLLAVGRDMRIAGRTPIWLEVLE
jgi:hypothetical protein